MPHNALAILIYMAVLVLYESKQNNKLGMIYVKNGYNFQVTMVGEYSNGVRMCLKHVVRTSID